MTTDPVVVLLRDDHEEFDALRDAVAEILGIPAGIVEKDYWATEVLRSVTRPMDGVEEYVFKGGTSLSKAFQIIQRFSEDIDLLVVTSKTGNSLKRLLRGLADRTNMELDSPCVRDREGKGYLNARFSYANRAEVTFLSDGVLLEMVPVVATVAEKWPSPSLVAALTASDDSFFTETAAFGTGF